MTAYELMDLRRAYSAEVLGTFKFWVSVTFAIIVAANVAGAEMEGAIAVGGIAMYLILTLVSAVYINRMGQLIFNTARDVQSLVEEMAKPPLTLSSITNSPFMVYALVGAEVLGAAAAIIYALMKGGFMG